MKTYLVTGGAGFIGSDFIRYLFDRYKDGIKVINLDKLTYAGNLENLNDIVSAEGYKFVKSDICDKQAVETLFSSEDIDYVVNFAAETHVDRSIMDSGDFVRTNVLGTQVLLETARKSWQRDDGFAQGKRFLQVSTDEVYGSLGKEGFFSEETPLDPHSPYSASKAAADLMAKSYHDTYGFPLNITRCSNNYGPYQFPEKLIPLMINNAIKHKKLPVYGDGRQVRDWLHVRDHSMAIDMVIRTGEPGHVYNIGGHNERENIHIVKEIIRILNDMTGDRDINEGLISHVADRPGHDRRYAIDSSKISGELGWEPRKSFEEGLLETVAWYLKNTVWLDNVTSGEYMKYYESVYGGDK